MAGCAILVWDGDGVIGKMYFTTAELQDACSQAGCYLCVENETMPRFIQSLADDQLLQLLASPSRTLVMECFNIGHMDARYQGQGIFKAMIEYFKGWARDRGWRRILAGACPSITPTMCRGPNSPRRGQLERRGFHVVKEETIPADTARWYLDVIEQLIAGKRDWPKWADHYVRNFERILAENLNWRSEYDKQYQVVCDL